MARRKVWRRQIIVMEMDTRKHIAVLEALARLVGHGPEAGEEEAP